MKTASSRDSVVGTLLNLAESVEPFCSELGRPMFSLPFADGARQPYPMRPSYLALHLTACYLNHCGEPPPEKALRAAIRALEARAVSELRREPVYPRFGWRTHSFFGPTIFLNLANDAGEYIVIHSEGWEIVGDSPALFAYHRAQLPLPRPPEPGQPQPAPEDSAAGSPSDAGPQPAPQRPDPAAIARLRSFFPCGQTAWRRCLAWLISAFHPAISYPILILQGPPASGKSTAARLLRALVDPAAAPLLDLPAGRHRIYSLASRQWVSAFDYVTGFPRSSAAALCRLSTGAEHDSPNFSQRDESFLDGLRRPVLLTVPDGLAIPPGLAARSLLAAFPGIPPANRRTETRIWEDFEKQAPGILAALCSAASIALRRLPRLTLRDLPACADAALWAEAAAPALGLHPGCLLAVFQHSPPDPLAAALNEFMRNRREWRGSASALLAELRPSLGRDAPSTPKGLSQRLRALAPAGFTISFERDFRGRTIHMTHRDPESRKDASCQSLSQIPSVT